MNFENLWPLAFLVAVPIIIILYILRPKGVEKKNSSNLLWALFVKNRAARTTFEKFMKNILMFLQILMVLFLVVALMSPIIQREGTVSEHVVLLFDTSLSMGAKNEKGETRLEEAIASAKKLVKGSGDASFTILAQDAGNTRILAVGAKDQKGILAALDDITLSQNAGNLTAAEDTVESLSLSEDGSRGKVIVFTDGAGLDDARIYVDHYAGDVMISGKKTSNLSNDYTVASKGERGYDFLVSVTNYSDEDASADLTLFDADDEILEVSSLTVAAGKTEMVLFEDVDTETPGFYSELSAISFSGSGFDSLEIDNASYGVSSLSTKINAAIIGDGNTYLERAVRVISGTDPVLVSKAKSAYKANYNTLVFDADTFEDVEDYGEVKGRIIFDGMPYEDTKTGVRISFSECKLTEGLKDFTLGINQVKIYELPDWATPLATYNGEVVAYYGEHDGIKDVVLGFNIRETDFALLAEYPVFMANTLSYLAGSEVLEKSTYFVSEPLCFEPGVDKTLYTDFGTAEAGLYKLPSTEEEEEKYYAVRLRTTNESNTFIEAKDITTNGDQVKKAIVKETLRNIFIILACILLVVEWLVYVKQMRYRGKFYLVTHIITEVLLILALFGLSVPRISKTGVTVFLVDVSYSNEERIRDMEDYIADMVKNMPANNQYGIVCFGQDAKVDQFLTEKKSVKGFMSSVDANATDLEDAIYRGAAMLPSEGTGRLVLLTDGKQTSGNIENSISLIRSSNIELLCLLYENTTAEEDAYVDDVDMPSYLHPGDEYTVTVTVRSNYETPATLSIYELDEEGEPFEKPSESMEVNLEVGSNRFAVTRTAGDHQSEDFIVKVEALGDGCEKNDTYLTSCGVDSAPKTLIILGDQVEGEAFASVLDAAGCDYDMVSAKQAPRNLSDMLDYKEIVLDNVFYYDLPDPFLEEIESYVKNYGGGLICVGGEQSYALGGYRGTVLEDILPVQMDIDGVEEVVKTAMVLVIDHSGSMSTYDSGAKATYLDVAMSAAIQTVSVMRPTDYIGVLSFDDIYTWNVPMQLVGNGESAIDGINTITDGGGTTINPALIEAYKALQGVDAAVKHVILLTDGYGEAYDLSYYQGTLNNYFADGITLSTVAVGYGSDTELLEDMANYVGGRYYYASAASALPRIFTTEVFMSGDTYIQNGNFTVTPTGSNEITDGLFAGGWPTLYGYINTKTKPGARRLLVSDQNDPILSIWQYGLGITCAWAPDTEGTWTGGYSSEEDYALLWKRINDYCAGVSGLGQDSLQVAQEGTRTKISYRAFDYTTDTVISAYYTDAKGEVQEVKLYATAPGEYENYIDTVEEGLYQINVRRAEGEDVVNAVTATSVVQYADEFRFENTADPCVHFIENNGAFVKESDNIWKKRVGGSRNRMDLTYALLITAFVLFLADVTMRRLQIVPGMRKKKVDVPTSVEPVVKSTAKEQKDVQSAVEKTKKEQSPKPEVAITEGPFTEAPKMKKQQPDSATNGVEETKADTKKVEKTKKQKKAEKKAIENEVNELDISSLLKKKDDRNLS